MKRDTKTKAFKTKFSLKQKSQTVDSPPPPKKICASTWSATRELKAEERLVRRDEIPPASSVQSFKNRQKQNAAFGPEHFQ